MTTTLLAVLAVATAGLATSPKAPRVFHVRDYGALPNRRQDSGPAIRSAIQAAIASGGPAAVCLEAGTYRVGSHAARSYCFPIHGAHDLTIRGKGASTRLVVTAPDCGAFLVTLGSRVALRDLSVDYDPAPFTQGTIKAVDASAGWFDLDVAEGFPTPDAANFLGAMEPYGKWGMIIDPTTRRIRTGTPDHYMTPKWERREGRVFRFFTPEEHYRRGLAHMRPGDSYVHLARGYGGAVLAQGCDGIAIDNITVHASPGLAVGLVGNKGRILVRKLAVRFPASTARLLTTNADGVHCQQNRSGPIIEDCSFEGMADDAVNIYAPPNTLLEKRADKEWIVTAGCLVLPGDRLQVLDPRTGRLRGIVKATAVAPEAGRLRLTLDAPMPEAEAGANHRTADTLYNIDACGAGFRVRNNRMTGNRRYGCLVRAGGGLVEGNVFTDTTGAGVTITNERDWPEGPVPWNITVRRNRFVRGGTCAGYADNGHGALAVWSPRLGSAQSDQPVVRGITIEDNTFEGYLGPAISAAVCDGLVVRGNRFLGGAKPLAAPAPVIRLERSRDVRIDGNRISDLRPRLLAGVLVLPDVDAGDRGLTVTRLSAELPPGVPKVEDRREGS